MPQYQVHAVRRSGLCPGLRCGLALVLGAGLALAGCESTPRERRGSDDIDTGLASLTGESGGGSLRVPDTGSMFEDGDDLQSTVEASASALDEYFRSLDERPREEARAETDWGTWEEDDDGFSLERLAQESEWGVEKEERSEGAAIVMETEHERQLREIRERLEARSQPAEVEEVVAAAEPDEPDERTPVERLDATITSLLELLEGASVTPEERFRMGLVAAGLEAMRPGAFGAVGAAEGGELSPDEAETLRAARELIAGLADGMESGDADRASALLSEIAERHEAGRPLRIRRVELCMRVRGFGQFDAYPSTTFAAGRRHPIIVYTEVDRFARRLSEETEDGDPRWVVELSQRLELYHDADGLNVWNRAAEVDRTVSRNRMRDYYLVNRIELPPTLGVGVYRLKVIMRDLTDGSVAEYIVPIRIVADESMARQGGRD